MLTYPLPNGTEIQNLLVIWNFIDPLFLHFVDNNNDHKLANKLNEKKLIESEVKTEHVSQY